MNLILVQLGDRSEYDKCELLDFSAMEKEAEDIIGAIHHIAMQEFMSRDVLSVWDWETRTRHMFENNNIQCVKDVVLLTVGQVNRLLGCGQKTRKEVYDIFTLFHIRLNHWAPGLHWRSQNYRFKEE